MASICGVGSVVMMMIMTLSSVDYWQSGDANVEDILKRVNIESGRKIRKHSSNPDNMLSKQMSGLLGRSGCQT